MKSLPITSILPQLDVSFHTVTMAHGHKSASSANANLANSFRILDLLPGQDDSDIQCTIRNAELGMGEVYEALSYVWGDQVNLKPVRVADTIIKITGSLYAALKHLRNPRSIRSLWIDQLCINQWDPEDKTYQVNMMRDIYRNCSQCLIWLGEIPGTLDTFTVNEAEGALDFLRLCAGQFGDSQSGVSIPPTLSNIEQLQGARVAFQALILNGNPWWSRVWTVQEVVLPPKAHVLWGALTLPWDTITRAAMKICAPQSGIPPFSFLEVFHDVMDSFTSPVRGLEIAKYGENPLNVLQRWRHRDATDPRDKVFALMGLFPSMPLPGIQSCDYNMSVVDLYTKVTIDLIQLEQDLRPMVGLRTNVSPSLPTWAIDLSLAPSTDTADWWWNHSHRYQRFAADGGENFQFKTLHGGSVLSLTGLYVDRVQEVGDVLRQETSQVIPEKRVMEIITSWEQIMRRCFKDLDIGQEYPNGHSLVDAFGRTMIGDVIMEEFPRWRADAEDGRLVWQFVRKGIRNEAYNSIYKMIVGQTFFITQRGYFGIGPPTIKQGDEVWVLSGGKVPFILRPRETGSQAPQPMTSSEFTLAGNAFVYGIMDGEAAMLCGASQNVIHLH